MIRTSKYDDMTDDELRSLPPAELRAFGKNLIELPPEVIEADLSQGEVRLLDIIFEAYERSTEKAAVCSSPEPDRNRVMTAKDRTFKLGEFDLKILSLNVENIGYNVIYTLTDDLAFNRNLLSDKEKLQQYLEENYRFEIEFPKWLAEYVIEHWR